MTTRNVLTYLAVIVVLVAALGAVNSYLVQPMLAPDLPTVEPLPYDSGRTPPVDQNLVAATLEKIRGQADKGDVNQEEFHPRVVERNPFLWPEEKAALLNRQAAALESSDKAALEAAQQGAVVRMILIGTRKKMALINDEVVVEGSKFLGAVVEQIQKDAVVLKGQSGEIRLALAQMSYAYLTEKAPPEKAVKIPVGEQPDAVAETTPTAAQQEAVKRLMDRLTPLMMAPQGGTK